MTLACLTLPELAAILRKTPVWLTKHWKALVQEHDFPAPIPGLGHHRVWHADAVEAWLRANWPAALRQQDQRQVELVGIDWEAELSKRLQDGEAA